MFPGNSYIADSAPAATALATGKKTGSAVNHSGFRDTVVAPAAFGRRVSF